MAIVSGRALDTKIDLASDNAYWPFAERSRKAIRLRLSIENMTIRNQATQFKKKKAKYRGVEG